MLHNETITFGWNSPEFEFKEKTKKWYWMVGIVGLILIVIALLLQNYLFGFLILVGVVLMFVLSNKQPLDLPIEVSEYGIKVYQDLYSYENDIYAFWISMNKRNQPVLLLYTSKRVTPLISLIVDEEIDVIGLREFLSEFIQEQEMKEPVTDRLIERIGF